MVRPFDMLSFTEGNIVGTLKDNLDQVNPASDSPRTYGSNVGTCPMRFKYVISGSSIKAMRATTNRYNTTLEIRIQITSSNDIKEDLPGRPMLLRRFR